MRGVRGKENCVAETKTMWQVGEELRKRGINSWGEEKEIHLTAKRPRKRTNSGGVAGTEGGSRGQRGRALGSGEWRCRRRAGVRRFGRAERPYLGGEEIQPRRRVLQRQAVNLTAINVFTHSEIITHNLIDSCEFSSRQFRPGGGSRRGHQGSSCQWGCGSVWRWHCTQRCIFTGQRQDGKLARRLDRSDFKTLKSC